MKHFYVGFPKTGTQSIEKSLKGKIICSGHKILREIKNNTNDKSYTFLTIRDPLKYYISMYKYKVNSKDSIKNYGIMENNSFKDFIYDYVLCNNIEKWEKPWMNNYRQMLIKKYIQGKQKNIGYFTILFIFYSYKDPENILKQDDILDYLKNNKPDVDHIIRLEHLKTDYDNLIKNYNYPYIESFKHVNKSPSEIVIDYNDYLFLKEYDSFIYEKYYKS